MYVKEPISIISHYLAYHLLRTQTNRLEAVSALQLAKFRVRFKIIGMRIFPNYLPSEYTYVLTLRILTIELYALFGHSRETNSND